MAFCSPYAGRWLSTGVILIASVSPALAALPRSVSFIGDVRPILSDLCFACHGPDAENRQADLRLDVEQSAKIDRGGYRVIMSGRPESSQLMARVKSMDEADRMPPAESGKSISKEQVAVLQQWMLNSLARPT